VPFALDGPDGFLEHLRRRVVDVGHAMVVVAEGAGQEYLEHEPRERDASGNQRLHDFGAYLRGRITEHFAKAETEANLKYIDPSYAIRSVPANPYDSVYCIRLAHAAVHAAMAGRTDGAIGYVEYAYALQNKMTYTQMKNRDGKFVAPEMKAFQAAAAAADWSSEPGFGVILTNQPGAESWPITGATFILMHKTQKDPQKAKQVLDFFARAYRNGDQTAEELHYVPMPEKVTGQVEEMWKKEIAGPDGKPVWTGPAS